MKRLLLIFLVICIGLVFYATDVGARGGGGHGGGGHGGYAGGNHGYRGGGHGYRGGYLVAPFITGAIVGSYYGSRYYYPQPMYVAPRCGFYDVRDIPIYDNTGNVVGYQPTNVWISCQ